jgi:CheY-like chemotaxis protein
VTEPQHAEVGENVLVVDDEPAVGMVKAVILSDLGDDATEAKDGAKRPQNIGTELRE